MTAGLGVTVVEVDGRSSPSITSAATSVAGLLVTTEAMVAELPKEPAAPAMPGGGGMGGMGGMGF